MLKFLSRRMGAKSALGIQLAIILGAVQLYPRYPFVLIGGALASAVLMFVSYSVKSFIEAIPTSKVRSVAMGMAELRGKALEARGTVSAPFSRVECLAYEAKEERLQKVGKNYAWVTSFHRRKDGYFYLDDGTGKLLCHTKGAQLAVSPFVRQLGNVRRSEWRILPGKTYYVIGKVADNPFVKEASSQEGWKDLMMTEGDIYIISDKKEKNLRWWYGAAFLFSAVSTAVFTALAFLI